MHILCLGINHITAPLTLREKLSFDEEALRAALTHPACEHEAGQTPELVILSTCNRIELYAVCQEADFDKLENFLSAARSVSIDSLHTHLYRFEGAQAVHHLLQVAAGLDSLVLGEPQILGQVTHALELAHKQGTAGPLLDRLFRTAIHAGKRAHNETAIGRNPASVSSLAASLCEHAHPHLKMARVVVLGAGEMAELAVEALRKRGVEKIRVINRTPERARSLAERWGAETSTFESLPEALCEADILIASTGAPRTLIHTGMVAAAMRTRPRRPLVLVDIAVPRDVDPAVADLPRVRLFDIDSLNARLEQSLATRAAEVPRVQAILAEEQAGFMDFMTSLNVLPLISDLHQQAESIRQMELAKTLRRLPDLTDAERTRIDALTQALVKKLLESPTRHLRNEATSPRAAEYATFARTLFGLEQQLDQQDESAPPISAAAD